MYMTAVYLEYETTTKQVVEIYETIPLVSDGYDYAISEQFAVGDEFAQTIWINEVDENKNVTSFSAIRNNPQSQRLLEENEQLKQKIADAEQAIAELTKMLAISQA